MIASIFVVASFAQTSEWIHFVRWLLMTAFGLGSQDAVFCGQILVPQKKFLIYSSGDLSNHACPKHFGFPPNLQPRESEIVDAVFQSEKSIRGEPVEAASYAISTRLSFLTIRHD
jgi:hypothetical protein